MGTIKVMEQMVAVVPVVPEPVDPAIGQRAAISAAIGTANAALATLKDDTSDATAAETSAVKTAIANAKTAIADGTDVPPTELAANTIAVSAIENDFSTVYAAISKTNTATSLADAKALLPALGTLAVAHMTTRGGYPTATLSASSAGKFEVTTDTPDFTMGDAPDMIAGWRGTTLEHTGETLVVYSNIDDGEAKPVGVTYRESMLGSNAFDVTAMPEDNQIAWADVMSDLVTTFDPDEGAEGATTFMGSVKSAMGTFTCEGTELICVDPGKTDGVIQAPDSGAWTFKPNAGETIDVPDDAYVYFGWWLKKDATAGPSVGIFTGVGGDMAFTDGRMEADLDGMLDGSATYEGGAAGKYALLGSTEAAGAAGHFTAAAMLMVDFDGDLDDQTGGDDSLGVSISGRIDKFMVGGEDPGWSVALAWDHDDGTEGVQTVGDNLEGIGAGTATTATWSVGSDVNGTGSWGASFYGTDEDDNDLPTAATGTFDATIGAEPDAVFGRIVGAFGVEKQ